MTPRGGGSSPLPPGAQRAGTRPCCVAIRLIAISRCSPTLGSYFALTTPWAFYDALDPARRVQAGRQL